MHFASHRLTMLLVIASSIGVACNLSSVSDDAADASHDPMDAGTDHDPIMMADGSPGDAMADGLGDPDVARGYDASPLADATLDVPVGADPLPPFDTATDQHVRDIVAIGLRQGNHPDVFSKIDDSMTETQSFLFDGGFGWFTLGSQPDIGPTITYFTQHQIGDRNSLNRASECAVAGWAASQALENYPDAALDHELTDARPMYAIIMYGTNDLERVDVGTYAGTMSAIVDVVEANGTVAVLSTIPPRLDSDQYGALVPIFNDAIRSLAQTRHLPLIDFWVALQTLPHNGIDTDGIHPNVYIDTTDPMTDACDFTPDALQFGYNVRNLTALEMLSRLRTYGSGGM